MKTQSINLKLTRNDLKEAMRLGLKLWIAGTFVGGLALASTVLGESGPIHIEKFECEGHSKTACEYIVDQISLREGEEVSDEKVREAKLRLQLLGQFDEVDIRLAKGSGVGKALLVISVREHSSYTFNASTGVVRPWRSFYGIADVTGADRNFSGHGDSLSLRLRTNYQDQPNDYAQSFDLLTRVNQEFLSRIEYIRPAFLVPRMYLVSGVGFGTKDSNLSDRGNRWSNEWSDIALGYKVFDYSSVAIGYRYFWHGNHSNPFVQYGWDSQDNPNFPTQGSRFQLAFDFNSGAFARYDNSKLWSTTLNLSYLKHWQLAEGHILSLRIGDFRANDPAFEMREDWALSLRYTNYFKRHATGSGIQNAAFYIEPGFFQTGGATRFADQAGVKVGATIQTSFAVFNVFAIASGL